MDPDDKWTKYRSMLDKHTNILKEKQRQQERFPCYYSKPMGGKYKPGTRIVIMEKMTSFGHFMCWFGLPMAGIGLCWLGIVFVVLWYYAPDRQKSPTTYHDQNAMSDALSPYSGGEGLLEVGKFPMFSPAACGAGCGAM